MAVEREYISTAEAVQMTGLSRCHVSKMCREGKIPGAMLIGNSYAIPLGWADSAVRLKETTVSINEAAELAGVTRGAIMLAAKEGRLVKIQHRITRDSLARYHRTKDRIGRRIISAAYSIRNHDVTVRGNELVKLAIATKNDIYLCPPPAHKRRCGEQGSARARLF